MRNQLKFEHGFLLFCAVLFSLTLFIFCPVFTKKQIPFSVNLLVMLFNPWAKEKFPNWEQGIPNKPVGMDDLRIFYPQRTFTLKTIQEFKQIPLWNPYNFSGNYHLGLSETAVFYPLSIIFYLVNQVDAWTILMFVQPLLAGVGMYLFLRKILKSQLAAGFAGLAWGFGGQTIIRMSEGLSVGHTLVWLPWIFYGIEGFWQSRRIRYLWLILFSLSSSLLSGWFQYSFYLIVFSAIYAAWRTRFKTGLIFLPYLFLPLVTAYHWWPTWQTLLTSPRGLQTERVLLDLHLLPLPRFLNIIFPDLWGNPGTYSYFGKSNYPDTFVSIGLVPLIFALVSLSRLRKSNLIKFFAVSALVTLFLAWNNPVTYAILSAPLPLISTFLPNRILALAAFSGVILAGFGLEAILNREKQAIRVVAKIILILGLIIGTTTIGLLLIEAISTKNGSPIWLAQQFLGVTKLSQLQIMLKNTLLPAGIWLVILLVYLGVRRLRQVSLFVWTGLGLSLIQLLYAAVKYIPFSYRQFVYPTHPVFRFLSENAGLNRFVTLGNGHSEANISLQFNLYSPEGLASMYPKRYGELISFFENPQKSRANVDRIAATVNPSPLILTGQDSSWLRFFQINGIKYLVVYNDDLQKQLSGKPLDSQRFNLVWADSNWSIFAYKEVLPRYFLTSDFAVIKDDTTLLNQLANQVNSQKILLEETPPIELAPLARGTVELIRYTPNELAFQTQSQANSLLYLSDTYSPQFKVLIDGTPAKLLRANYAFRAISLPAGNHRVVMIYDSTPIKFGLVIAGGTLLLLVGASVWLSRFRQSARVN